MRSPDSHIVRWSPDGDKYAVVINDQVDVYVLETASVAVTITNPKRISSLQFLNVGSVNLYIFLLYRYHHRKDTITHRWYTMWVVGFFFSSRIPSLPLLEMMTLWGCMTWEKRRQFVSLRLMKQGKIVSHRCLNPPLSRPFKVCEQCFGVTE